MDIIKQAQHYDAVEIRALILDAVKPEDNEDFNEEGKINFLQPNSVDLIEKRIEDNDYLMLCYIKERKIVGLITLYKYEKLDQLFVHPDSRNMKVATKLWRAAKEICARNGNKGKYWTKSSTLAVNVYKSFGFKMDGDKMKQNGITYYPMILKTDIGN